MKIGIIGLREITTRDTISIILLEMVLYIR